MSCFKVYTQNLAGRGATFVGSSENSIYPASNVGHDFKSKVFRSTSNGDNLVIDFGSIETVNTFMIVPSSEGFGIETLTLELNSTDSWGSPQYSQAITFNEEYGFGYATFADINVRFARLVMTSTLGFCEVSKVFLGTPSFDPASNDLAIGFSFKENDLSRRQSNEDGQEFVDIRSKKTELRGKIDYMNQSELDQIIRITDEVSVVHPLWLRIDETTGANVADNPLRLSGYFKSNTDLTYSNSAFGLYSLNMSFSEAK